MGEPLRIKLPELPEGAEGLAIWSGWTPEVDDSLRGIPAPMPPLSLKAVFKRFTPGEPASRRALKDAGFTVDFRRP